MRTYCIYHLASSEHPDRIRYVGITTNPQRRLSEHRRTSGREGAAKSEWCKSVISSGFTILMNVIAGGMSADECMNREKEEFARLKSEGFDLVNGNSGGCRGFVPTDEVRAKLAAMSTGRKHSPETIEKMRTACRHETTDETRAKLSRAAKGRTISEEHRRKISEAHKGRSPHPNAIAAAKARKGIKASESAKKSYAENGAKSGARMGRKYRGVTKIGSGFCASLFHLSGTHSIQMQTEDQAAKAWDIIAFTIYGDGNSHLNFPENADEYRALCVTKEAAREFLLRWSKEARREAGMRMSGGRPRKSFLD